MSSSPSYCVFLTVRVDLANERLWRGEEEISLRRKTFDVLRYLVERPGQLVTKVMLLDAVWADVSVSDSLPATSVAELRRALDDDPRKPRFIETVYRRGYRFIAPMVTASTSESRHQPTATSPSSEAIIVGRDTELAQLRQCYSDVPKGQRRIIFVSGEAGIGKTTFVQAFLNSIHWGGQARLAEGQCIEHYGDGEPYMPVLEALSRLGRESQGQQIIELLSRFAPTWLAQMPELLTRDERVRLQSETHGVTRQRMLREMTQALEALSAEMPLVLLLEDLHWSDFSTVELISAIARRKEPARLAIIGTYRPVEILAKNHPLRTMKQELEIHHYCDELRLNLLNEKDIVDYLAKRLATVGPRQFDALAPVIHARTDGNPLFMANMVDYLLIGSGLRITSQEVTEKDWAEALRAHNLDALRGFRQMIERNLERLRPEEQAVLEGASVVGPEFSAASVAAALELPLNEVEECCTRLSRHEQFLSQREAITWSDGTVAAAFRFRHAFYQEVLYARLPVSRQVGFHRRIALREEAGYEGRAHEVAVELAHHYSDKEDRRTTDSALSWHRKTSGARRPSRKSGS